MAHYTFGKAISEEDVLEIQGVEYRMQPVGMRAMRKVLGLQTSGNGDLAGTREQQLDAAIELVIASVIPEDRDRLREHIEESIDPGLLAEISVALTRGMADVDPTLLESSSPGSTETGPSSTDGAGPEGSTPLI